MPWRRNHPRRACCAWGRCVSLKAWFVPSRASSFWASSLEYGGGGLEVNTAPSHVVQVVSVYVAEVSVQKQQHLLFNRNRANKILGRVTVVVVAMQRREARDHNELNPVPERFFRLASVWCGVRCCRNHLPVYFDFEVWLPFRFHLPCSEYHKGREPCPTEQTASHQGHLQWRPVKILHWLLFFGPIFSTLLVGIFPNFHLVKTLAFLPAQDFCSHGMSVSSAAPPLVRSAHNMYSW